MLTPRALMLLGLFFTYPAQAGLFSDDEARDNIQRVEVRVLKLEGQNKQQTQSILDLQSQIELINGEIRKLRGMNEEMLHGLQDAEKREKDFYVDLDTRLRRFEPTESAAPVAEPSTDGTAFDDPAAENRAIEAAYGLFRNASYANAAIAFADFLKKYPDSVHVPNAKFWLGDTQFALKDYKSALETYRALLKEGSNPSKAPDILFNIAACQQALKAVSQANATLKQLMTKYPESNAAAKAKKLLAVTR